MKKIITTVLLTLTLCGCSTANAEQTKVENRFDIQRSDSENVYIITDNETGVQYLGLFYGRGCGVCVLVDQEGNPISTTRYR